jgi:hypothetical protein
VLRHPARLYPSESFRPGALSAPRFPRPPNRFPERFLNRRAGPSRTSINLELIDWKLDSTVTCAEHRQRLGAPF